MMDVVLPAAMQQVMAMQKLEAIREKRARIIKAGGRAGGLGQALLGSRADDHQSRRARAAPVSNMIAEVGSWRTTAQRF